MIHMRFKLLLVVVGLLLAGTASFVEAEELEFVSPYSGAVDTAIAFNATTMDGPNIYEKVAGTFTWDEAKAAAASMTYPQCAGPVHLATITSQEEQDAVHALLGNSIAFGFLGGYLSDGQWQWVTGEPWDYTNWQSGEPSVGEVYLHIGGGGTGDPWIYDGKWNNTNVSNPYIVEYENCSGVYDWDFGDGTQASNAGPTPTHSYSEAGIYDVSVTVTNDGGAATYDTFAVVYDPSAGFVTGGGWIDSPAGAYAADPSLAGKATFGFVSKYQNGASVPTGNTEFQFHTAGLNFRSDSYEWLVVTGSDYAMLKGVGTTNGDGEYKFRIWAGDGNGTDGADTFRIKIWEETNGVETVVYDNGMDQPIAGGSIVVHTK